MKARALIFLVLFLSASYCSAEERCLRDAWDAYNRADYAAAIRAADSCISDLHAKAERDQAVLKQRQEPEPPKGAANDAEKQKIFARGVLNDTAAAYFVKGRSAEALAQEQKDKSKDYLAMARAAYRRAENLTYARVWDPQGWFWSPAEAAADRLSGLS